MRNVRKFFAPAICVLGLSSAAPGTALLSLTTPAATQSSNLTINASVATAFEAGAVEGVFIIRRSDSTAESLDVRLQISGSATNGVDYQTIPAVVQIPAGSASIEVRVRPIDDTEAEADELVTIGLADIATNSESTNTRASLVLKDNDTVVQVGTQASGTEAGTQPVVFRFNRSGNLRAVITVNFAVSGSSGLGDGAVRSTNATAVSGVDFNPPPASITFQVGETSKTLSITPIDDSISEPPEVVELRILPSPLYTLGATSSASGIIEDNDTEVQVFAQNPRASEAGRVPAVFSFTRTGDSTTPLTISYLVEPVTSNQSAIADGTSNTTIIGESTSTSNSGAVTGTDFVAPPGTLTFQAGEVTRQLDIVPIDDTIPEGPESFRITIRTSALYKLGRAASASATIEDNDQPQANPTPQIPFVSIQATVSDANEAGPVNGIVTINRTGLTSAPLTVLLSINGPGSTGQLATNGVDFEQLPDQVVIPTGASSTTVTIRPVVDDVSEPQERVVFQIAPSPNYSIQSGASQATVKIKDNHPHGRP